MNLPLLPNFPRLGDKYTHYKDPEEIYTVVYVGYLHFLHSWVPCVVYRNSDGHVFVRKWEEFFSTVNHNGQLDLRFKPWEEIPF